MPRSSERIIGGHYDDGEEGLAGMGGRQIVVRRGADGSEIVSLEHADRDGDESGDYGTVIGWQGAAAYNYGAPQKSGEE